MKETRTCPKCDGRKLLVVDEVRQPVTLSTGAPGAQPLYLAAVARTQKVLGLPLTQEVIAGGRLESWICARCGFTEWYTNGLDDLAAAAAIEGSGVRIEERETDVSPYR
jgi:predicted nucleic-acid-binding Zn-ribbon protein